LNTPKTKDFCGKLEKLFLQNLKLNFQIPSQKFCIGTIHQKDELGIAGPLGFSLLINLAKPNQS